MGLLARLEGFSGVPWRGIATGLFAVSVFWAGWQAGAGRVERRWEASRRQEAEDYREAVERAVSKAAERQAEAVALTKRLQQELDLERSVSDALRTAIADLPAVDRSHVDAKGCPDPRVSRELLVCFGAAFTGTPADVEACAAAGRGVPAAAGGGRVPVPAPAGGPAPR